jgi:RNA polymerase sigma-70 factor (ECF subfamily)
MRTDFELLDAWSSGSNEAGEVLLGRHCNRLARFFFNKVSEPDHEDLVQRTLLACVKGRDNFRRESSFRSFLFAVARNELRMHLRQKRPRATLDLSVDSLAALGAGASTAVGRAQAQTLLLDALRQLPVDTQLLLELRYWEELPSDELAEMFDVTTTTVRTRLHRARQQLRDRIEQLEADPSLRTEALGGFETWARELHADPH